MCNLTSAPQVAGGRIKIECRCSAVLTGRGFQYCGLFLLTVQLTVAAGMLRCLCEPAWLSGGNPRLKITSPECTSSSTAACEVQLLPR